MVVDCTGVVITDQAAWEMSCASIASHMIRLAVAQQIIDFEDLVDLVPGERFTLADLLRKRSTDHPLAKRYAPDPDSVDDMCAAIHVCAVSVDCLCHM